LESEVYPNRQVADIISRELMPVRIHVKEQPAAFERFGAQWTPTVAILDPDAVERHRIEGFLDAPDFAAQLELGLAKSAFARKNFADAERRFRSIVDKYPRSDAAAESQYWAGVSKYKATNDPSALGATAAAFKERYQDTPWAKKASIWSA
jgi:TolA-binding protein